jgi:predicted nucleic acid-binding protein
MRLFRKKVTLDSNVIISGVTYGSKTANKAIDRSVEDDRLMMTNVIYDECMKHAKDKKKSQSVMKKRLDEIAPNVIQIEVPTQKELKKKYRIRDDNDYKILYSADVTNSKILVSGDNDFHQNDVKGPRGTKIVRTADYANGKRRRSQFPLLFRRCKR